jgi:hypothetical protein
MSGLAGQDCDARIVRKCKFAALSQFRNNSVRRAERGEAVRHAIELCSKQLFVLWFDRKSARFFEIFQFSEVLGFFSFVSEVFLHHFAKLSRMRFSQEEPTTNSIVAVPVAPPLKNEMRGEIRLFCITDYADELAGDNGDESAALSPSIAVVCPTTKLFAFGHSKQAAVDAWIAAAAQRYPQLSAHSIVLESSASPLTMRSYKVWLGDSEVGNAVYIFELAVEVVFFAPVSRQIATSRDRRWQLLASVDDVDGDALSLPDFVFEDKLDAIHVPMPAAAAIDV